MINEELFEYLAAGGIEVGQDPTYHFEPTALDLLAQVSTVLKLRVARSQYPAPDTPVRMDYDPDRVRTNISREIIDEAACLAQELAEIIACTTPDAEAALRTFIQDAEAESNATNLDEMLADMESKARSLWYQVADGFEDGRGPLVDLFGYTCVFLNTLMARDHAYIKKTGTHKYDKYLQAKGVIVWE